MRALLVLLLCAPAAAQWQEVPRKVLVLYRPEHIPGPEKDPSYLPAHMRAELALNYAGLHAEYLDASQPLPEPGRLAGVRGVLAWFPAVNAFPDPRPVCRWLSAGMRRGWRLALIGQVGLHSSAGPTFQLAPECAETLSLLGVESRGVKHVNPLSISTASYSGMVGFERQPDPSEKGQVPVIKALPGGRAQAKVEFLEGPVRRTEPVVLTERGGIALDPYALYINQELSPHQVYWIVDPFAFLEAAFAAKGLPRPDPATLSGRRVFMTRIDGDGFFNLSEVDRKKTSGEVFLEQFLEKEVDNPFTVSLIAGYYDLALYNDRESLELSRRSLSRPNVEPASHGYAHPLVWKTGKLALQVPRYSMDSRKEIVESGRILEERILPAGRRVRLFQWTGDCLPSPEEVAVAEGAGLLQINGGGGRFDRDYPSYGHLFPMARPLGALRQVYAGMPNENEYTDLWTARFYGYRDVIETFERTGAPRRVKPVDFYFHFYSAERYASLKALHQVYAWARARPLIPVWGGRYAAAVNAFSEMKVARDGARFRLKGGAWIRTVRFDGEGRSPDLSASRGVVGWRREGSSLYVSLDESGERVVALSAEPESGARLEEANFEVERFTRDGGGVRFTKRGWWKPEMTLAGLRAGARYRVSGGGPVQWATADARGRLSVRWAASEAGGPASQVAVEAAP